MNLSFLSGHPLTRKERASLATVIAAIEKNTAGEVRVALQRKRQKTERDLPLAELALRHFRRMGMDKTKAKTGVLLLLLLSEHKLQILADEGINQKVMEGAWDAIAAQMSGHFKVGQLHDGLLAGLTQVGELLAKHFPVQPGDRNELPDQVDVT